MLTALTGRINYIRSRYIRENDSVMAVIETNAESMLPLTPAVFHVLLALVEGERHGYAIMREVAESTLGQINMGPGTLYGTIKRLLAARLIEESNRRPDPKLDDERRRYYRLTGLGQQVVKAEALRYEQLTKLARRKRLIGQTARVGHARGS
jgi:DNA-binding PadR family transcriptional regulator